MREGRAPTMEDDVPGGLPFREGAAGDGETLAE